MQEVRRLENRQMDRTPSKLSGMLFPPIENRRTPSLAVGILLTIGIILSVVPQVLQAQSNAGYLMSIPLLSSTSSGEYTFADKAHFWSSLLPSSTETPLPPALHNVRLSQHEAQPYAYDPQHLAFFCRLEVQLERVTKIPVRFRLGDVQQVDYLEGKFTGWRYGY